MAIEMMNCLLRPAVFSDWAELLVWRNDALTRENSINSDFVAEENHKKWLMDTLENPNRTILMYECDSHLVGTVRFDYLEDICELSWTMNPEFRGKGLSKNMIASAKDFSRVDKIRARVKFGNESSVKIALNIGLLLVSEADDMLYFSNYGTF